MTTAKQIFVLLMMSSFNLTLRAESTWNLESSTVTYHVSHPMHNTVGQTNFSRGKGLCSEKGCDFLIAAPVNTFKSGDDNRDLHMIQAVKGGLHPMVSVRTHVQTPPTGAGFQSDLLVDLAGQSTTYSNVAFDVIQLSTNSFLIKGTFSLVLTQHGIERPALLGVPIKDLTPIDIETRWQMK